MNEKELESDREKQITLFKHSQKTFDYGLSEWMIVIVLVVSEWMIVGDWVSESMCENEWECVCVCDWVSEPKWISWMYESNGVA